MSMKLLLALAAGVLAASPALAMSNSQIAHHTGGPIPYSQLMSTDHSGYNARSHKKGSAAASAPAATDSATSNAAATLGDQNSAGAAPAPAPAPTATPDTATTLPPASSATTTPAPAASPAPPAPAGAPR
ncbi:MAG TPA: hypothetical protein VIJ94_14355 [Caulobacteraceae bacterium]